MTGAPGNAGGSQRRHVVVLVGAIAVGIGAGLFVHRPEERGAGSAPAPPASVGPTAPREGEAARAGGASAIAPATGVGLDASGDVRDPAAASDASAAGTTPTSSAAIAPATPTALALAHVELEVVLPDGSAPAAADIELSGMGYTRRHAWTPERRVATVEPGKYTIRATVSPPREGDRDLGGARPRAARFQSGWQLAILEPALSTGGTPARVRCALLGRPSIHGRLTVPEERRGRRAIFFVRALRFEGVEPSPEQLLGSSDAERASVENPGDDAEFELTRVTPGSYLVGVSRGLSGGVLASRIVEVPEGPVRADLALPPRDPSREIILHVLDERGDSVRAVRFGASLKSDLPDEVGAVAVEPSERQDGAYVIDEEEDLLAGLRVRSTRWARRLGGGGVAPAADSLAGGVIVLRAETTTHGTATLELPPGRRAGTYTLRFLEPARVDVVVRGYAGSGLEGSLALVRAGASAAERLRVTFVGAAARARGNDAVPMDAIDAGGRVSLGPVEPGEWEIILSFSPRESGAIGGIEIARQRVTLVSGANSASVGFPPLHAVTIEGAPRAQVAVSPLVDPDARGDDIGFWVPWRAVHLDLDGEGRGTLSSLPAGEYTAESSGRAGSMTARFRVPASGPVKLVAVPREER